MALLFVQQTDVKAAAYRLVKDVKYAAQYRCSTCFTLRVLSIYQHVSMQAEKVLRLQSNGMRVHAG
jgi:hypothetical protein